MSHCTRRTFLGRGLPAMGLMTVLGGTGRSSAVAVADPAEMIGKAVNFLRPKQGRDGSWSGDREPGITALVVTALLRSGRVAPDDPAVTRGLTFLERYVGPKGGLSEAPHSVYTTSVALMAFQEASKGGRYDRVIKGGQDFLKSSQVGDSDGKSRDDASFGGVNYGGGTGRPDLSNTSFMMEALRDSGLPADDPALQRALIFVSRCQNLKSEFNDQPWAGKINDGGFVYNPGGGDGGGGRGGRGKAAAKAADAAIPSTAGMTYAGLKSMIYAGLTPDDPRVKAAVGYIKDHYTLDENPGQGQRGAAIRTTTPSPGRWRPWASPRSSTTS